MFGIALILLASGIHVSSLQECRSLAEEWDAEAIVYYPDTKTCQIVIDDPDVQITSN